ncbi:magnesium transporter CorA family protein [Candidatus Kaiserbacteria bacterium]|nr:magnesium transporter CorA family protein [Candidatus Kaiserbacteria bacterium]MCB9811792.1 magnesium transporter CorA family protein [Candidatus Nomurabacteria bacterium]
MVERYKQKQVVWLDVLNPTPDEIREIAAECSLPPEFTTDLTSMTPHTEATSLKNAFKITLDFPVVKRTDINHPHEIKFIATKSHLITIRFEEIEVLHRFAKEFEVLSTLDNGTAAKMNGGRLLIVMLLYIYKGLHLKLDYLETKMQDIEENIFEDNEKEMLFEISKVSRRLIAFRHSITAHEDVLETLEADVVHSFGKTYSGSVHEIKQVYEQVSRRVLALSSTLQDLRDTNDALLSTKQNEVMKILTIMAFITFPLTLFTSMFGMNTTTTPILGHRNDFWIILGIMLVVSIGFFAFFKYKRWM